VGATLVFNSTQLPPLPPPLGAGCRRAAQDHVGSFNERRAPSFSHSFRDDRLVIRIRNLPLWHVEPKTLSCYQFRARARSSSNLQTWRDTGHVDIHAGSGSGVFQCEGGAIVLAKSIVPTCHSQRRGANRSLDFTSLSSTLLQSRQ